MNKRTGLLALAVTAGLSTFSAAPAFATGGVNEPVEQVCGEGTSGKVDVTGAHSTLTITAPEGQLIASYCVKAGSSNQGEGPEIVELPTPLAEVPISHTSGKDISHYSYTLVPAPVVVTPVPETPEVPETPPTPVPEVPVTPEVPETPTPEVPVTPEVPENPTPETPEVPETPSVPGPETPTPETPEVPETPEAPENPAVPVPETPEVPEQPTPEHPVEEIPAEEVPVEVPEEETPAEDGPVAETPAEGVPADKAPVEVEVVVTVDVPVTPVVVVDTPDNVLPVLDHAAAGVSYENCTEVRDVLGRSILLGEEGFRSALDRDGDGIGCELDSNGSGAEGDTGSRTGLVAAAGDRAETPGQLAYTGTDDGLVVAGGLGAGLLTLGAGVVLAGRGRHRAVKA
ncbi:excalibur calcium-binding domain-containing protein [Arthrobacter sp. TMS2-4]